MTPTPPASDVTIPEKPPEENGPNFGDGNEKTYDKDSVTSGEIFNVVISSRLNGVDDKQDKFYAGQTIDEVSIVRALNAFVRMTDGTIYYWTSADLGKYLRVNGVSFDGGQIFTITFINIFYF